MSPSDTIASSNRIASLILRAKRNKTPLLSALLPAFPAAAFEFASSPAYSSEHPHPDLILLDINMPLGNGWEFLETYQNVAHVPFEFRRSTVIIMLTTSLRDADAERVKQFPFVKGFIHKPLTAARMEEIIVKHFRWRVKVVDT